MSIAQLNGKFVPIKLWTPVKEVESSALDQLKNVAGLPWCFHHVAVMPDVHFGKGATVGSVIAMKGAVSPAAVGVDIGCGMGAIRTNLTAKDLPDDLKKLRERIEELIPVGFSSHEDYRDLSVGGKESLQGMALNREIISHLNQFRHLTPEVASLDSKANHQLGTLGGGNHFIELCLDESDQVWMVLHSGSRNIGKSLAEVHIAVARKLAHNQLLPDRDLAVFLAGTSEMKSYRHDLMWAQEYAFLNRRAMFQLYKKAISEHVSKVTFEDPILCHHNYVSEETHFGEDVVVTRKGAIRAGKGEMGIIPGSMGTASYIVEGLGSEESFCSASHGAGRRLSRGAAKREFTLKDLQEQTAGIECRKDEGVIDEIPGAYKDIDKVMENQKDLVKVKAKLRQVLCVKG